jgi:hypothetical protein
MAELERLLAAPPGNLRGAITAWAEANRVPVA